MEIVRQVLAVILVFALMGAALWVLRRNSTVRWNGLARRKPGRLESIERLSLSPHHTLHLVRAGDRALLIATHAAGCTLIENTTWKDAGTDGIGLSGGEPR